MLIVEPPAGVRVGQLVYPHPTDFAQQGQNQALAVFEREFVVGAELAIGPDLPPGDPVIPARLRYQACDDKVCFRPITATITLDRAGRDVGPFSRPQHEGRFRPAFGGSADQGPSTRRACDAVSSTGVRGHASRSGATGRFRRAGDNRRISGS